MPEKRPVERVKITSGRKKIYDSIQAIRDEEKFCVVMIYRCLRGASKNYKGYRWRYINE